MNRTAINPRAWSLPLGYNQAERVTPPRRATTGDGFAAEPDTSLPAFLNTERGGPHAPAPQGVSPALNSA